MSDIFRTFDAPLPSSQKAEMAVLGCLMLDGTISGVNNVADKVASVLENEDFSEERHRNIFKAAIDLHKKGTLIDLITLSDYLETKGKLEDIGGAYYLTELSEQVPSTANVFEYINVVKTKSNERLFITNAANATSHILGGGSLEKATEIIERSFLATEDERDVCIADAVKAWISHIELMRSGASGVYTGVDRLDEMIGGFHDGEFIIIAGRPSTGKSSLAFQIANHASIKGKTAGGIFTLEMPAKWVAGRIASQNAHLNLFDFSRGTLNKDQWMRADIELAKISDSELQIHDNPGASLWDIRAKTKEWVQEFGIEYVLIDYLQLVSGRGDSRTQELTHISRGLKQIAREVQIPVIAISQLNRANETGVGVRAPRLSDLRGSGAIEQDADVVIFVHRQLESNDAELIVGKQRNGPVGKRSVEFIPEYAYFAN